MLMDTGCANARWLIQMPMERGCPIVCWNPSKCWDKRLPQGGSHRSGLWYRRLRFTSRCIWLQVGTLPPASARDEELRKHPTWGLNLKQSARFCVHSGSESANKVKNLCEEGHLETALDALILMHQQGCVASVATYEYLLQACSRRKALPVVKLLHAHIVKSKVDSNGHLANLLVLVYVKFGSFGNVGEVFKQLPHRTAGSWHALISGHLSAGQNQEAFRFYKQMRVERVSPNKYLLVGMLKACGSEKDLEQGKQLHDDAVRSRLQTELFVGTALVDMYAKCGRMTDAHSVFQSLRQRDVVSWNVMIAGYARQGEDGRKALYLYKEMCSHGLRPGNRTFVSVLKACGSLAELEEDTKVDEEYLKVESLDQGRELHAEVIRRGYESDVFVASSLLAMYAKSGSMIDARCVFDGIPRHDVVSWTAMITVYAQQGHGVEALQLYEQMLREGVSPNDRTFVSAIKACGTLAAKEGDTLVDGAVVKAGSLKRGKVIHEAVMRAQYETDLYIASSLVNMYAKCGDMANARLVFDALSARDVVAWTAMITGYAQQNQSEMALQLYSQMRVAGVSPDKRTFASLLTACAAIAATEEDTLVNGQRLRLSALHKGRELHAQVVTCGQQDECVGNALIHMYAQSGNLGDARLVFDKLSQQDVVSWNTMIGAYAQHEQGHMALSLYAEMQQRGIRPDRWTFESVLKGCGALASAEEDSLVEGQLVKPQSLLILRDIHAELRRMGHESDIGIGNTLVCVYATCGDMLTAQDTFGSLSQRFMVSWTAMSSGYARQQQVDKALQMYTEMQESDARPDQATFISLLKVCSSAGALEMCHRIHHDVVASGMERNVNLATSLIHAYGKCNSMVRARQVLDMLPDPDVAAWNALISGYAWQGESHLCFQCFDEMQMAGETPNAVTFLSVLTACSHAGMVHKGIWYFESMIREHRLIPTVLHYSSLVDLLGRAGLFDKVEELLVSMPVPPDYKVWLSLLGACRKYNNVELGRRAFDRAVSLEPRHSAAYLLMSSIYANARLWKEAKELEPLRQRAGAWKVPGRSWIELDKKVYSFLAADQSHTQTRRQQIYAKLQELSALLRPELLHHHF